MITRDTSNWRWIDWYSLGEIINGRYSTNMEVIGLAIRTEDGSIVPTEIGLEIYNNRMKDQQKCGNKCANSVLEFNDYNNCRLCGMHFDEDGAGEYKCSVCFEVTNKLYGAAGETPCLCTDCKDIKWVFSFTVCETCGTNRYVGCDC